MRNLQKNNKKNPCGISWRNPWMKFRDNSWRNLRIIGKIAGKFVAVVFGEIPWKIFGVIPKKSQELLLKGFLAVISRKIHEEIAEKISEGLSG